MSYLIHASNLTSSLVWKNRKNSCHSWSYQTDVAVLTFADKTCLKRLFKSCMFGDFGRGMREFFLFSGVVVV